LYTFGQNWYFFFQLNSDHTHFLLWFLFHFAQCSNRIKLKMYLCHKQKKKSVQNNDSVIKKTVFFFHLSIIDETNDNIYIINFTLPYRWWAQEAYFISTNIYPKNQQDSNHFKILSRLNLLLIKQWLSKNYHSYSKIYPTITIGEKFLKKPSHVTLGSRFGWIFLWAILLMWKAYFQSFSPVGLVVSPEKNNEFWKKNFFQNVRNWKKNQ
jgi:hypothetical protein